MYTIINNTINCKITPTEKYKKKVILFKNYITHTDTHIK